jgi:hypothetical protein
VRTMTLVKIPMLSPLMRSRRIMLRKQLADMKERRADPSEHCESGTDIEDLYDMKENNSGVVKEGLGKGTKAVAIQDKNNTTSDPKGKCKATEEDCRYLSNNRHCIWWFCGCKAKVLVGL